MERKFRRLRKDEQKNHLDMLNFCFNPWGDEEKWRSKYCQEGFNIDEDVMVVEENEEWIGGCTAWFREAFLKENKKVKGQLAGDGYALPSHTGKGVYITCVESLIEPARKKGASLGFGFVTIYGGPFRSLLKTGYIDLFHPTTKMLILNPEKFFKYMVAQAKYVRLPSKFECLKVKLLISMKCLKGKAKVCKTFEIKNRRLCELASISDEKIDLKISANIETLFKIFRYLHFKKKLLFVVLLTAFLRGRFTFRFSLRFVRVALGL